MLLAILFSLVLAFLPQDDLALTGVVFDGEALPVPAATVVVQNQADGRQWEMTTDEEGTFRLERLTLGTYQVSIRKEGYFDSLADVRMDASKIVEFTLAAATTAAEVVEVIARPEPINAEAVSNVQAVNDEAIQNLPYTGRGDFQNALTLMPGVLQDNYGRMHIHGSNTDQIRYQLDGMNLTDPGTGGLSSDIPIDSIESVDIDLAGYSAEFGKGSGGVVRVNSQFIQDDFWWNVTDFIPGINFERKTIGEFSPRLLFSGPVVRGKLWFMYSGSMRYVRTFNEELPEGANRQNQTVADQFFKLQWNAGESNVFTFNLLNNAEHYSNLGLNAFRPMESTTNVRRRGTTASVSSRMTRGRTILQTIVQWSQRKDTDLAKGDEPLEVRPYGWSGNFFTDRREQNHRFHIAQTVAWENRQGNITHRFKTGLEFDDVASDLMVRRRPFQAFDSLGYLQTRVEFEGGTDTELRNREYGLFFQDRLVFGSHLQLEIGARADREEIIGRTNLAPRFAFSWMPLGAPEWKLSGGLGFFYDPVVLGNLQLPRLQRRLTTTYDRFGVSEGSATPTSVRVASDLTNPRGLHWNFAWEQEWAPRWVSKINYVEKRGRDGVRIAAVPDGDGFILEVNNSGNTQYRALELSLDRPIRTNLRILAAYTYSSARGRPSLSMDFPDPQLESVDSAPLSWDIPHRFLSWGYFPFFGGMQASYAIEARSGFPYSVLNTLDQVVGPYHAARLPVHFVTNFSLEKELSIFFGKRIAVRAGVTNMFNRFNPRFVDSHIDSPAFMRFSDSSGRSFVGRVRLLD